MKTTYPPVMQSTAASVEDFPDHANVLAVIATFQDEYSAIPWAVLVDVVASLPSIGSGLALSGPPHQTEQALVDIVADLRTLGLVEMTSKGTISTSQGDEYIERWNGKFASRKAQAQESLAKLRFPAFIDS